MNIFEQLSKGQFAAPIVKAAELTGKYCQDLASANMATAEKVARQMVEASKSMATAKKPEDLVSTANDVTESLVQISSKQLSENFDRSMKVFNEVRSASQKAASNWTQAVQEVAKAKK
jgi:hypothetical protein